MSEVPSNSFSVQPTVSDSSMREVLGLIGEAGQDHKVSAPGVFIRHVRINPTSIQVGRLAAVCGFSFAPSGGATPAVNASAAVQYRRSASA